MKHIALTQNKTALVDDEDYERLKVYKWYAYREERKNRTVYYAVRQKRRIDGQQRQVQLHREVLKCTDQKTQVDHINGNGLDNQKNNLRLATNQQNCQNQHKVPGCSSRYKGVTLFKESNKWKAQIRINGHKKHLGLFKTEKEAAKAYDSAARQSFKNFALTNSR